MLTVRELIQTIPAKPAAVAPDSEESIPGVAVVYRATPPAVTASPLVPPEVVAGINWPFVQAQKKAPAGTKLTDCFRISPVDPTPTIRDDATLVVVMLLA